MAYSEEYIQGISSLYIACSIVKNKAIAKFKIYKVKITDDNVKLAHRKKKDYISYLN